jgi:hypothetical protein
MSIGDILLWEATNWLLLIPVVLGLMMLAPARGLKPYV